MEMKDRLKERYNTVILPEMMKKFNYTNKFQAPRLEKIVLNMGVGDAIGNSKVLDGAVNDLTWISGQKPIVTRAKKAISNFRLRAGMPIGCKVTLRGRRMYQFFDKLINVSIPRIRDFRGLSPHSFDGYGNYSMGITEQIIFPEIDYDKVDKIRGLDVTIVTSAGTDEECFELLKGFGMPFKK